MKHICTVMYYRLEVSLGTLVISGTPRASETTYLRKSGNLSTREILVITWPYASPSTPQENQCNVKPVI